MPTIGFQPVQSIDPHANSLNRSRRNWQQLVVGGASQFLQLITNGGLQIIAGALGVKLQTAGALNLNSGGLGVSVDGATITVNGSNQLVSASGSGVTSVGLQGPTSFFTVTNSPITTSGVITQSFAATATITNPTKINPPTNTASTSATSTPSLVITRTYNQTGTANGTDLLITRTNTAVGSGPQSLISASVNNINKFKVDTLGTVTAQGNFNLQSLTSQFFVANNLLIDSLGQIYNAASGLVIIDANANYSNQTGGLIIDLFGHFIGSGTAPGITAHAGAGTSPTVSLAGSDEGGTISVTTGSLPSGSTAVVVSIAFVNNYPGTPKAVILTPANAATAALGNLAVFVNNITVSGFDIDSNVAGLVAATAYKWYYQVIG